MVSDTTSKNHLSGYEHYVLWVVSGAAFCVAYLPVLAGLFRTWAHSDDYSHCFAIIPLAAYILWRKRQSLRNEPVRGSWTGLIVVIVSILVYLLATKGEMQTLASVSMITFLWGSVIFLLGYAVFKTALFPLAILLFMIPVPAQIIAVLTIPLQLIVTRTSVWLASMIGIPIIHEGNVISLPMGAFEVVQACSGLRSIMSLLTIGTLLAYLMLRSNLLRIILFGLTFPIALMANVARVFTLVTVFHFLAVDLSKGLLHTILGLTVFVVACGLFILAGKGLSLCER